MTTNSPEAVRKVRESTLGVVRKMREKWMEPRSTSDQSHHQSLRNTLCPYLHSVYSIISGCKALSALRACGKSIFGSRPLHRIHGKKSGGKTEEPRAKSLRLIADLHCTLICRWSGEQIIQVDETLGTIFGH